jgi:hypothetical protein
VPTSGGGEGRTSTVRRMGCDGIRAGGRVPVRPTSSSLLRRQAKGAGDDENNVTSPRNKKGEKLAGCRG